MANVTQSASLRFCTAKIFSESIIYDFSHFSSYLCQNANLSITHICPALDKGYTLTMKN